MRCPKCGFISFDDLVACAHCNFQMEGKSAPSFEGTAIRAQHVISLRAMAAPEEPEFMPAEEEQDTADGIYQELAAESLEAGLVAGEETEEEGFDLSLAGATEEEEAIEPETEAETEDAGIEIPVLEIEEEIPAIDLSGLGDEETDGEATADRDPEPVGEAEPDGETEDLELDLAMDEEIDEGEPVEEEAEEVDLASGAAANLEGIDLSGLMGEEDLEEPDETAEEPSEEPDGGSSDGIYDLSDLIPAEGDADDAPGLEAEDDGETEPDGEALLDLTFDGEDDGETAGEPLELDLEADEGGEELELRLELEGESDEHSEDQPMETPEDEGLSLLSGLSLENEDDD